MPSSLESASELHYLAKGTLLMLLRLVIGR